MKDIGQMLKDIEIQGWSYQQNFFEHSFITKLTEQCKLRNMHQAAIGKNNTKQIKEGIRSDKISWLTNEETNSDILKYQEEILNLKNTLNEYFYLGLNDFEGHFAIYPEGSFYKKHIDRFKNDSRRTVTFITYLNEDWKPEAGGQLKLYLNDETLLIEPHAGSVICFLSDKIEHEVLIANKERMSLTGWFLSGHILI